ncbi:MAG: FtsX-like permease family protein [Candidatus Heimdallarchaeota archaeon]|nr:FtsX-like permease family protein [Candidatus Heimdallarchaeota archaeon]
MLSLLIIELFNIGNFEKTIQFKLFKTYGLEFGTLRKILFTENLLSTSIGLILGIPLGTLIGFAISSFGLDLANKASYFNAYLEPVVYVIILALFSFLIIGGFITELAFARRTVQLTSEVFKSKRKKFIRRIFTSVESLLLISGIITFIIGFLGWRYIPDSLYIVFAVLPLLTTFVFLMIIGILLTLASLFLILSRLIVYLWRYIGVKIWQKRKSYFTLALKQLATYSKDYNRAIFAMLLVSLCISPGLVLMKSSNDHLAIEANLKVGFSDICVMSWADNDSMLMESISTIIGVDLLTKVELVEIRELGIIKVANPDNRIFDVNILNIYNVSEFIEIISPNFPESCKYPLADISELETNMTYMMSSKFAQKNNYDKNETYSSSEITSLTYATYNMIFINKFDYFPLVPYKSSNFLTRLLEDNYNLVMSNLTYSQLKYKFDETTRVLYESYILVRINPTANKTLLVNMIESLPYPIRVTTFDNELNALKLEQNKFALVYLIIITIISFGLISFYGILTARNIYKQKMRIIESEYNIGAKKHQIWLNFSVELIFVIIIPIFISVIISSILLYYIYDIFLGVQQTYKNFVPWLPVWFIALTILFCLVAILGGWLSELWIQFHKYKPARQE